ncbi:radical SAM family heme chaperone HemW [Brumimicrobium aurantiacum]|uniref:Heme chaperone HemW n=1 Tax=Brumimicrobium aurantiacum TaxID=1737063 RepID=A0A3E1F233_9FLAO|nr:radical SAM family heme chaperone HemW [Brumimicrobium aurantiacum]RFC55840.1 radical SAM family heme chaperone HemW [Brumimicrobium aurantiacum]
MAGIYIHIPFCKQKCTYCDFHFSTSFKSYREKMIQAICLELTQRVDYLQNQSISTVYFGGGTPSLLTKEELKKIVDTVSKNYTVEEDFEFTLEANPDDITEAQLEMWKAAGVNRLSIGLQSFLQEDLDWMNRAHTAIESESAVRLAKKFGFQLTVDLIYGLPNRSLNDWKNNIQKLTSLDPEHISAYCLTIEKRTALHHMVDKGDLPQVSEDDQSEQFEMLLQEMNNAGYHQYEISNFAKGENYSRHNSNYWNGVDYLGIGPSAHSFDGKSRRWNIANNPKYIKGIFEGFSNHEDEILSSTDQFNELLLTGLRTKWGVNYKKLSELHKPSEAFIKQLNSFRSFGLIQEETDTILLTQKGKLQADYIAAMLFLEE